MGVRGVCSARGRGVPSRRPDHPECSRLNQFFTGFWDTAGSTKMERCDEVRLPRASVPQCAVVHEAH